MRRVLKGAGRCGWQEKDAAKNIGRLFVKGMHDARRSAAAAYCSLLPELKNGRFGNTRQLPAITGKLHEKGIEIKPPTLAKYLNEFRRGKDKKTDTPSSLYARGMSVREIQGHLKELYHTEVSPALISAVTDAVADEVRQWQGRLLDPV